jgi:hypothetical protein
VVQRSHPEIAGRYADWGRYALTETGDVQTDYGNLHGGRLL